MEITGINILLVLFLPALRFRKEPSLARPSESARVRFPRAYLSMGYADDDYIMGNMLNAMVLSNFLTLLPIASLIAQGILTDCTALLWSKSYRAPHLMHG